MNRQKLRRRYLVLALVAVLATVCCAFSAWWGLRDARASMQKQVRIIQALGAEERSAALTDAIRSAKARLSVTANWPGIGLVLGSEGSEVWDAALKLARANSSFVSGLAVTDRNGTLIAQSGRAPVPMVDAGPVFRSSADRRVAYMTIRAPVRDAHGVTAAWVSQEISLGLLSPQFIRPFPEFQGATSLVRRDGTVVMTSMRSEARVRAPELAAMIADGVPQSGSYWSPVFHARRMAAVRPVTGTDLMVLVSANAAAASEPATALVARVVVLFLITLAVVVTLIGVAVVLLRSIRRDLESAREAAARLARTDPLTGVGNRRAFDDIVEALRSDDDQVGLVVIDLDDLKVLNDRGGHATGDAALQRAAMAIGSAVRPDDVVARVGGDEFVVLLTKGGSARADQLAIAVRTAIGEIDLPGFGPLSASTGVAVCPGRDLIYGLNRADELLYEAKRARLRAATTPP